MNIYLSPLYIALYPCLGPRHHLAEQARLSPTTTAIAAIITVIVIVIVTAIIVIIVVIITVAAQ